MRATKEAGANGANQACISPSQEDGRKAEMRACLAPPPNCEPALAGPKHSGRWRPAPRRPEMELKGMFSAQMIFCSS